MNLVETGKRIMVGTGAQAVLWVLILLSVVSVAIIVERAITFLYRAGNVETLRKLLVKSLEQGGFDRALAAMSHSRHPAALVATRGLGLRRGASLPTPKEAEEAMEAEMVSQKTKLESGLGILATLGANAPFVGLFGTVVGIVGAFDALGHGAGSGALAGGAAATTGSLQLMASIGEALVATAVGIGVAIPAVAAFNTFSRATKKSMAGAEILQKEILTYLQAREVNVMVDIPGHAPTPGASGITLAADQSRSGAYAHGF